MNKPDAIVYVSTRAVMFFILALLSACLGGKDPQSSFSGNQTVCLQSAQYPDRSQEDLKNILVVMAKSQAYGQVRSTSAGKSSSAQPAEKPIREDSNATAALSLSPPGGEQIVKVKGTPRYFNGKNFGELCALVEVYIPTEACDSKVLQTVKLDNYCTALDDTQLRNLRDKAQESVIRSILSRYNSSLKEIPLDEGRPLLREFQSSEPVVDLHNNSVCLNATARVFPPEIESYRMRDRAKEEKEKKDALNYKMDLSKFSIGDLATQFGSGLVVVDAPMGRALQSNDGSARTARATMKSSNNFTARLYFTFSYSFGILSKIEVAVFKIKFANGWTYTFNVQLKSSDKGPMARINMEEQSSEYVPWNGAANVNEFVLSKDGRSMKVSLNGTYLTTFTIDGDSLSFAEVYLNGKNYLYGIGVESK